MKNPENKKATVQKFIESRNEINKRLNEKESVLKSFEKLESGLVENSPEFRKAQNEFNLIFKELQNLNRSTPKKIKIEASKLNRIK